MRRHPRLAPLSAWMAAMLGVVIVAFVFLLGARARLEASSLPRPAPAHASCESPEERPDAHARIDLSGRVVVAAPAVVRTLTSAMPAGSANLPLRPSTFTRAGSGALRDAPEAPSRRHVLQADAEEPPGSDSVTG